MQLHIEDLIFRWTQAGAPIIPSMKDSIERVTKDDKLREYFWERLRPKFLTINPQTHSIPLGIYNTLKFIRNLENYGRG